MGWIKTGGGLLVLTGEVLKAEGFEEWAKDRGASLIERYASEKFSGILKKRRAKKSIGETFRDFLNHKGFRNKLNSLVNEFHDEIGSVYSKIEGNDFSADGKLYALPRAILHDRFDKHVRENLKSTGDMRFLNEKLAESLPLGSSVGTTFLDYFIPKFRNELVEFVANNDFSNQRKWINLGSNWLMIDCEPESYWGEQSIDGHYVAINKKTSEDGYANLIGKSGEFSSNIFDVDQDRRQEIVNSVNEKLDSGDGWSLGGCPDELVH